MISDAEAAALYDQFNPWDPEQWPGDAFYAELALAATAVLDVGCGTGGMLHWLRTHGHTGRLVGIDPDPAALARARARTPEVEWVDGPASAASWDAEFPLAIMTGHAFQFLVTDDALRDSLAAIRTALRPGGRFAFETRHPQARAWEQWTPAHGTDFTDPRGRALRTWYEVTDTTANTVTFTGTIAEPDDGNGDGRVLRTDRTTLRFLDVAPLNALLAAAGFETEAQYGSWDHGPLTPDSREIITLARRR